MDFIQGKGQSLPSPAPSSSLIPGAPSLPTPRHYPLKPGSQKEIAFINFIDSKILHINRRYAKKFSSDRDETDEEARGYEDFDNVVEDIEHVLDAIWVSATRKHMTLVFEPFTDIHMVEESECFDIS